MGHGGEIFVLGRKPRHPNSYVGDVGNGRSATRDQVERRARLADTNDRAAARQLLREMVLEYRRSQPRRPVPQPTRVHAARMVH